MPVSFPIFVIPFPICTTKKNDEENRYVGRWGQRKHPSEREERRGALCAGQRVWKEERCAGQKLTPSFRSEQGTN